jgi:VIT1/CCC1 family predicted Fe2+/Mn2+ transporter
VRKEDVYGALASGALVVLSTVPAALPFLLIDEPWRALRLSNLLLVGLLFVVGYEWGRQAHTSPWLAGLAFLGAGIALVAIAIALGG